MFYSYKMSANHQSYTTFRERFDAFTNSDALSEYEFVVCSERDHQKVFCTPICPKCDRSKPISQTDVVFHSSYPAALADGYAACPYCKPTCQNLEKIRLMKLCLNHMDSIIEQKKLDAESPSSCKTSADHVLTTETSSHDSNSISNNKLVAITSCRILTEAAALKYLSEIGSLSNSPHTSPEPQTNDAADKSQQKKKKRGGLIGFKELAAKAKLSPWHFHRVFKSITGLTPKAYGDYCCDYLNSLKNNNNSTNEVSTPPPSAAAATRHRSNSISPHTSPIAENMKVNKPKRGYVRRNSKSHQASNSMGGTSSSNTHRRNSSIAKSLTNFVLPQEPVYIPNLHSVNVNSTSPPPSTLDYAELNSPTNSISFSTHRPSLSWSAGSGNPVGNNAGNNSSIQFDSTGSIEQTLNDFNTGDFAELNFGFTFGGDSATSNNNNSFLINDNYFKNPATTSILAGTNDTTRQTEDSTSSPIFDDGDLQAFNDDDNSSIDIVELLKSHDINDPVLNHNSVAEQTDASIQTDVNKNELLMGDVYYNDKFDELKYNKSISSSPSFQNFQALNFNATTFLTPDNSVAAAAGVSMDNNYNFNTKSNSNISGSSGNGTPVMNQNQQSLANQTSLDNAMSSLVAADGDDLVLLDNYSMAKRENSEANMKNNAAGKSDYLFI